ncbi:four helix bundle protein [Allomuricauda sp. SCSIO 65647]|uniref:four helix bundle protein n=1 Tax=Allomuricauda sp. SCSIO 65647 TaxID=2908843 RepID=UPI001F450427|nr:four helix bundle protein [Muricauda sp. SCSIO 65647]UJH69011.1 four helix bundle protein [Muricauda sp. SCSIO 65647]
MGYRERNNPIVDKSFYFGCDIVRFSRVLKERKEFEIATQLIRCGTSIGANTRESQRGVSTKDFKNKLGIALKEADETSYWLDVIEETTMHIPDQLKERCEELIKLLVAILKNS